jgi:hypothetical protein
VSQARLQEDRDGFAIPSAEKGRAAQYYVQLGPETGLQINVHIWGQVLKPGLYVVPAKTDLIALVSYAGGPTINANLKAVKVVRGSGKESDIVKVNVKEFMETGDISLIPILLPGDTVIIPASNWHAIARIATFVSQLTIIVYTYAILTR